jgi:hypothetical protein
MSRVMTAQRPPDRPLVRPATGVATLTMVMVLFFVMAMVAAYTNRNLLYEQRISINNFRATVGMSAADAGIDWAVAMLNGARVDGNCVAPDAPVAADVDFRSRYTTWKPDGAYGIPKWLNHGFSTTFAPICVMNGATWVCRCPADDGEPTAEPAYPANSAPIFKVEIGSDGVPGVVKVDAWGTHESSRAASFEIFGNYNRVRVKLGLTRALPVPPVAALTAGGTVTLGVANSKVSNTDPKAGFTIHSGEAFDAASATNTELIGATGSVGGAPTLIESDGDLKALTGAAAPVDFFQSLFGMDATTYSQQPAAVRIDCAAGCTSASIATAVDNNPGRIIWLNGDLTLDTPSTLGSVDRPVMLLATGNITLAAKVIVNGFLYSNRNVQWNATATDSLVRGAVVAKGNFDGLSAVAIAYDGDMMQRISLGYGSFVRVPGSWQVVTEK